MRRRIWMLGLVGVGFSMLWVLPAALPKAASSLDLETLSSSCAGEKDGASRLRCLKPYFEELTRNGSVLEALAKAKALQRGGVIEHCHLAAHFIGRANLAKNSWNPGLAMATCSEECLTGCYHGVMEAYVSGRNWTDMVPTVLSFCDSLALDYPDLAANTPLENSCIHGSAHGLMMALKDSPSALAQVVGECRKLKNPAMAESCMEGAFMENVHPYVLLGEAALMRLIPILCDPVTPLNDSSLTLDCIKGLSKTLLAAGFNLTQTQEMCRWLNSTAHQAHCIQVAIETDTQSQRVARATGGASPR